VTARPSAARCDVLGEEGLAASREAVDTSRRLAEQRPDTFLPDFADSLHNLASRLGALGRYEEVLAAIHEAVEIRRRLARGRPTLFGDAVKRSLRILELLPRSAAEPASRADT